jgi:hypothetical protein
MVGLPTIRARAFSRPPAMDANANIRRCALGQPNRAVVALPDGTRTFDQRFTTDAEPRWPAWREVPVKGSTANGWRRLRRHRPRARRARNHKRTRPSGYRRPRERPIPRRGFGRNPRTDKQPIGIADHVLDSNLTSEQRLRSRRSRHRHMRCWHASRRFVIFPRWMPSSRASTHGHLCWQCWSTTLSRFSVGAHVERASRSQHSSTNDCETRWRATRRGCSRRCCLGRRRPIGAPKWR